MGRHVIASENRSPWPYAEAVLVRDADLIVCSGQVAFSEVVRQDAGSAGDRIPARDILGKGDVCAQTRQALENLRGLLAKAGATMDDVVHLTVYLTDVRQFARLGEIAQRYFNDPFPGLTLVGLPELGWPDLLVEIQAIAAVPRKGH